MTTILKEIEAGMHDSILTELESAISTRLLTVRETRTAKDFGLGDKVRFNTYCGTKYLQGRDAVVVGMKQKKLVVKMTNPVGRFVRYDEKGDVVSSDIVVPPSIVDLVL
jgi:hypothetical protein